MPPACCGIQASSSPLSNGGLIWQDSVDRATYYLFGKIGSLSESELYLKVADQATDRHFAWQDRENQQKTMLTVYSTLLGDRTSTVMTP